MCLRSGTRGVIDSHPKVVNYRELELSTVNVETFFPRIPSRWITAQNGIRKKTLETQVGDGISWQRRYISLSQPDRVYRLMEVKRNHARVYQDEDGQVYLQRDLDHPPLTATEINHNAFMATCDAATAVWKRFGKTMRQRRESLSTNRYGWYVPQNCQKELEGDLLHVWYAETEYWLDLKTGYRHYQKPVLFQRGFVQLLKEGEMVFVRNIAAERGRTYWNWMIRADEQVCTINDSLYFKRYKQMDPYRIKRRSDDFRMFVLEPTHRDATPYDLLVVNSSNKPIETRRIPNQDLCDQGLFQIG